MGKFLEIACLALIIAIVNVNSQQTDFGYFCYGDHFGNCTSNDDCGAVGTCVNSTCQAGLPGAACTATSGCAPQVSTCRAGKCVLTAVYPYAIAGCPCNANNACPFNQKCVSGTCRTGQQAVGEPCSEDGSDCVSTAYCNNDVCVAKRTDGNSCGDDNQCQSNYCFNNECFTRLANGQVCSYSGECQVSSYCEFNTTSLDYECVSKVATGQNCTYGPACISGLCSRNTSKCVNKLLLGDDCFYGTDCLSGNCVNRYCATARLANGQNCSSQEDCLSHYCSSINDTCQTPFTLANGQLCSELYDCQSLICHCTNSSCEEKKCVAPFSLPAGAHCGDGNPVCGTSASCVNDVCVAWGSGVNGSQCNTGRDCGANLFCNGGTCRPDTAFCQFSATCSTDHVCNCTGPANNQTMGCVPAPAGTTNYFASSIQDPLQKFLTCQYEYYVPFIKADITASCQGPFDSNPACRRLIANSICCAYCGLSGTNFPVFVPFLVDCAAGTITNRTQTCSGESVALLNCDKFPPPTSTTTDTNTSPAIRLNAIFMLVVIAIAFVVCFF